MTPAVPAIDWIAFARLASGPLVLATALVVGLWWRRSLRGRTPLAQLAAITGLTLFLCFDLVGFGAYTRLTDSGLGCPDWPGCYAEASPVGAAAPIAQAQAVQPTGPVTERKAWIEMIHRYLAGTVGTLIVVMVALAVRARAERRRAPAWALASLGAVVVQAAFGAFTVTWRLYPAVVTGHLLGGIGLVALLAWQRALYRRSDAEEQRADAVAAPAAVRARRRRDRLAVAAAAAVLGTQIALGGWVSTNYAVMACQGFPTCNGHWWPAMAWREGFTFLHDLGRRPDGHLLGFDALVAIHWTHRLFAVVAVAALVALALRFRHRPDARRLAATLGALVALQVATGLSNVVLGWPLAGAVLHTAGAAALVMALCALGTHLRDRDLRDAGVVPGAHPGARPGQGGAQDAAAPRPGTAAPVSVPAP